MDRNMLDCSMSYRRGNDIACLPTIDQLVDFFRNLQAATPIRHLSPVNVVVNDPDRYIITRLMSGRYSVKPNITMQSFLYRGENRNYTSCVPKEFRGGSNDDVLLANIRANDFVAMLESHPLYRMLKNGVKLSDKETVRIENPYGMASCYGLDTLNLSLTSSLEAAAFYAVSEYDAGTNSFSCVEAKEDDEYSKVGAIYAFFLAIPFPAIIGLSSVGYIPFPHLEHQRTFIFQMSKGITFQQHQFQKKFFFRHDKEKDAIFFAKYHQGEDLTLNDEILHKARQLMSTNAVSKSAFEKNLRDNPHDNESLNRKRLEKMNIYISPDVDFSFSDQDLAAYRQRMSQGYWYHFCNKLVFAELRSPNAMEIFMDLPNNPKYSQFFV